MHTIPHLWRIILASALSAQALTAAPAFHVVKAAQQGTPVLANGDFEQSSQGRAANWNPAPNGAMVGAGQGRNGTAALVSSNQTAGTWAGASQTIQLNRTEIAPLVVRGWSKAHNVSGSADSGYSLYVDLVYADGTPLWGQTANFPSGTHDWVRREAFIIPQKPVKALTLNCILRGHSGLALFDDVTVEELKPQGGTVLFQGVPVTLAGPAPEMRGKSTDFKAGDRLRLKVQDNSVQLVSPQAGAKAPSGFLVRDVAADSDFYTFANGRCPELGLSITSSITVVGKSTPEHIRVSGRISDTTSKDRAITLVFALPVEAEGWSWGDDIRRERKITGNGDFVNVTAVPCGAGSMSLYPLAAISSPKTGLALGLDMSRPAVYRVGYNAGTRQLYIAYDFGLVYESRNFRGAADFQFILFSFDSKWGFRSAWDKYMRVFEEHFRVNSKEQGIWMPFTDVSTVQGWEDFGFKYHEGNNNVKWDDEHGVLSFRYTEPMTWWMRMSKGLPRTFTEALRVRDELAESGNGSTKEMARVSKTAAMLDESGQPTLMFRNEPWCDGAVWSINPNPYLNTNAPDELNGGTVHWNPSIKEGLYGSRAKGKQDGEYLDSLEGYVTTDLNFRRDHFASTTVPLTFSLADHRPALFKGLAVYEFTRWISGDVRGMGKLMFANGVPYRFGFLCPWLDVLGTETDWVRNGKYSPSSDSQMCYWRTLSGSKPYVLLMNTDYDTFTSEMVERYFQRSLFYGMFPSMFSHNAAENPYWQNPKWYNRDRPLFKKYQPVIKGLAEAGWRPVTGAKSDNPKVLVERFGADAQGTDYLTVLNDSGEGQHTQVHLVPQMGGRPSPRVMDLLSKATPALVDDTFDVELAPQEAKVFALPPLAGQH